MKLAAEIAGEKCTLEVKRACKHVHAQIDGRRYELDAHEVEPDVYLFNVDGRVYECRVNQVIVGQSRTIEVHVGHHTYQVVLIDPKRLRGARSAAADADGRAEVKAPMHGKVVRVLVERDAVVEAGDGLVVIEAMKMQNEMKAPKSGIVVELHAAAGATVNAGDVLVVIE